MIKKGFPSKELKKRNEVIYRLYQSGIRKEQIAVKFDISFNRVTQIINRHLKQKTETETYS